MANNNPAHVVTGKVRFSYEHLLKPYKNDSAGEDDAPKYSVTILVPKSDKVTMQRINAGIAAAKKRGVDTKRYKDGTPPDKLPTPIWDGDGFRADGYSEFGPECKGMWVFTASTSADQPPKVVDVSLNPIIDPTEIYSGIWGRVGVDFFPYNFKGKQGVGCSLVNVQKLADDEPLGAARASVESDFGDDYDPLG